MRSLILAALLHSTQVVGISQTAALSRGRHLYSAGRPSRWALAHILVMPVLVHMGTKALTFWLFGGLLPRCWRLCLQQVYDDRH